MELSNGSNKFEENPEDVILSQLWGIKKKLIGVGMLLQACNYDWPAQMLLKAETVIDDVISELKGESSDDEESEPPLRDGSGNII